MRAPTRETTAVTSRAAFSKLLEVDSCSMVGGAVGGAAALNGAAAVGGAAGRGGLSGAAGLCGATAVGGAAGLGGAATVGGGSSRLSPTPAACADVPSRATVGIRARANG